MLKHYILSLDPLATYEWERCTLRDPMTAAHATLAELVAKAVGDRAGSYLVAVTIDVQVLEAMPAPVASVPSLVDVPARALVPVPERVA